MDVLKFEEEGFLTTGRIILLTFLFIVLALFGNLIIILGYLYVANQALIKSGGHVSKKRSKKSKKGKEFWSYGD